MTATITEHLTMDICEFILHAHEMAMDKDDPQKAATGRGLKELIPMMSKWMEDELLERQTDPNDVANALVNILISMAQTFTISNVRSQHYSECLEAFANRMQLRFQLLVERGHPDASVSTSL